MSESIFTTNLQTLLQRLPWDTMTIILGDFNIDLLKTTPTKLLTTMNNYGYKQYVQTPTTDNGTLIDHVYVRNNQDSSIQVQVLDTYYTDHDLISVSVTLTKPIA